MANEVVKYAPKAVIEELDKYTFPSDFVAHWQSLHATDCVDKWLQSDEELLNDKFMAIMLHISEDERLQPERETRWTVEKEINGYRKKLVFDNGQTYFCEYTDGATYMFGLTEEQARGYAELFGGEPREIK